MEVSEWAKLQESLLKSQLKVIRAFLKHGDIPRFKPRGERKSQMNMIYDILKQSPGPLHVNDIIAQAKEDFHMELDRESVVSAISKKIKKGRMFKRVGPNIFTILDSPSENTS